MFRRAVLLVAVVGAVLGPAVFVGGAAEPILKLALQRADVPAPAIKPTFTYPELTDPLTLRPFGAHEAAHYYYSWSVGTLNTPIGLVHKEWVLEGDVFRAADESAAKRLFALGKAAKIGFFSADNFPGELKNLNLPAYGDEQIGGVSTHQATGLGVMVFVRKGTVVWQLRVAAIPLQFQPTEAEMVAVLQMYAAKQKARVTAG